MLAWAYSVFFSETSHNTETYLKARTAFESLLTSYEAAFPFVPTRNSNNDLEFLIRTSKNAMNRTQDISARTKWKIEQYKTYDLMKDFVSAHPELGINMELLSWENKSEETIAFHFSGAALQDPQGEPGLSKEQILLKRQRNLFNALKKIMPELEFSLDEKIEDTEELFGHIKNAANL